MDTKALANRVAAQHGTRDPFRIAEELGFIVIRAPLVEMRGLRQYVKRRTIVYVNACLDEPQQRRECAEWSDEQVARWMGVPLPLARYRRSTVPPLPGDKNPF